VREADGLAMSSRNKYLSPAERAVAPVIHRALSAASEAAAAGEKSPRALLARVRSVLAGEPLFRIEYVEMVGLSDLKPFEGEAIQGEALLAVAGRLGQTRLIDNVIVAVKA
jgi:pantoate--beta-alanine ligase